MRRIRGIAIALVSAATLTLTGAGSAQADGLLDVLSPLVCGLQNNVAGNNNEIHQAGTCDQAATTTPGGDGDGITGYEVVPGGGFLVINGGTVAAQIPCPAGKRVLSGGVEITSGSPIDLRVATSGPNAAGTSWTIAVAGVGAQVTGEFYAICANAAA
ncbi:hypothetical protein ACIPUC_19320 [Streptomyces sp. LARHCF249]